MANIASDHSTIFSKKSLPLPDNKEMVPVESHDRLRPKGTRHLTNREKERDCVRGG